MVWNIPPQTRWLDPIDLPADARAGMDTFGPIGEMGPPPPAGRRHYRWKIPALDAALDRSAGALRIQVDRALCGHVVERARLTAIVEHPAAVTGCDLLPAWPTRTGPWTHAEEIERVGAALDCVSRSQAEDCRHE